MTKDELGQLNVLNAEIKQLQNELARVEPQWTQDAVTGSDINFPYCAHQIKIEGYNYEEYERKVIRIKKRIAHKVYELMEQKDRLTEYIFNIDDSLIRQILTFRHINGYRWESIGAEIGYDESTVRKKYNDWFNKNIEA